MNTSFTDETDLEIAYEAKPKYPGLDPDISRICSISAFYLPTDMFLLKIEYTGTILSKSTGIELHVVGEVEQ